MWVAFATSGHASSSVATELTLKTLHGNNSTANYAKTARISVALALSVLDIVHAAAAALRLCTCRGRVKQLSTATQIKSKDEWMYGGESMQAVIRGVGEAAMN